MLLLATPAAAQTCDAVWRDAVRGRDLPVRIRLPEGTARAPLVLYSPGLGGNTSGGSLWAEAWVARGIAVINLAHPGSDGAVYRDVGSPEERRERTRAAVSGEQLQARAGDVSFILDEIASRRREGACDLGRIDTARVGIAGHSMGAWTAQGLAGQRFGGRMPLVDRRIKAAIAFSPSALDPGPPGDAFGAITIPFMSVTGTLDGAMKPDDPRGQAARTAPFAGMAPGQKYLLLFDGGTHKMFGGNRGRAPPPTAIHIHALAGEATSAFWGMTLFNDRRDREFLATGLNKKLAPGDRFERK